jgi:transposase
MPRFAVPSPATILPDPTGLHLLGLAADTAAITATVITTDPVAACPLCEHPSTQVHARDTRRLADLPWHGIAMRLVLYVRKFFCDNVSCARRVFTERLPEVVAPYARRTLRLEHWFTVVGFAAGGAVGARLLRELGLVATPVMVLARLRAYAPTGPPTAPRRAC